MHTATLAAVPAPVSKWKLRTGWIATAVAALFLLFDGILHLTTIQPVVDAFAQLGFPMETAVGLGITELVCLALYLIPRTSVLGAILLTGYLGGAIAAQVRIGSPLFTHALFPVYLALLIWGGLALRDERVAPFILSRR